MKKVIIYGVAVAFLCVAGFSGLSMAADDKGPADINMTIEGSKKPKPAQFPHAAHQERIECDKCHKDANYTPAAWTKKTAHALCKDCHKAAGDKKLTKCGTCHPKKKK